MPSLRDILRRLPRQPSCWLVLMAAAVYLMLPGLFVGHLLTAHVDARETADPDPSGVQTAPDSEACVTMTVVVAAEAPESPAAPHVPGSEHPPTCDLCLLLAKIACAGPMDAGGGSLVDQPVPVGRVFGIDQPLLGARIPIAVQPRAPPRL